MTYTEIIIQENILSDGGMTYDVHVRQRTEFTETDVQDIVETIVIPAYSQEDAERLADVIADGIQQHALCSPDRPEITTRVYRG